VTKAGGDILDSFVVDHLQFVPEEPQTAIFTLHLYYYLKLAEQCAKDIDGVEIHTEVMPVQVLEIEGDIGKALIGIEMVEKEEETNAHPKV
jgi:hypothetical protein